MKATISISVDVETIQLMKCRGINPSKWFAEKMKNEFKTKEDIINEKEEKIKEEQEELKRLKEDYHAEKERMQKMIDDLSNGARDELFESKKVLERDISYFDARYGRFKNLFNNKITEEDFRKLLENIKL